MVVVVVGEITDDETTWGSNFRPYFPSVKNKQRHCIAGSSVQLISMEERWGPFGGLVVGIR